jgi:hypothetical protein
MCSRKWRHMHDPEPFVAQPDRATWPCRYCRRRDSVLITLRQPDTVVCFCSVCEQGWCADERGQPRD